MEKLFEFIQKASKAHKIEVLFVSGIQDCNEFLPRDSRLHNLTNCHIFEFTDVDGQVQFKCKEWAETEVWTNLGTLDIDIPETLSLVPETDELNLFMENFNPLSEKYMLDDTSIASWRSFHTKETEKEPTATWSLDNFSKWDEQPSISFHPSNEEHVFSSGVYIAKTRKGKKAAHTLAPSDIVAALKDGKLIGAVTNIAGKTITLNLYQGKITERLTWTSKTANVKVSEIVIPRIPLTLKFTIPADVRRALNELSYQRKKKMPKKKMLKKMLKKRGKEKGKGKRERRGAA